MPRCSLVSVAVPDDDDNDSLSLSQPADVRPLTRVADTLCVLDGHNLAYRLFYGAPMISASCGTPVNVVNGFCKRFFSVQELYPGARLLMVFDEGKSVARNDLLPAYKGNRRPMPADLRPQIELVREVSALFGVPTISSPGVEADDIIAACVSQARIDGATKVIVTSTDKDLMQLVSPSGDETRVTYYHDKLKAELDFDAVKEVHGVHPDRLADYLALVGDSSDNIIGVPGVGPKTAVKLIDEYGDLDAIVEAAVTGTMKKSKRRQHLVDSAELLQMNRRLIRLDDGLVHVPLEPSQLRGAVPPTPLECAHQLLPFLRRYELMQVEKRLMAGKKPKSPKKETTTSEAKTSRFSDEHLVPVRGGSDGIVY